VTSEPTNPRPVAHLIAPIVAIGVTMLFRKALNRGYQSVTGSAPPDPMNPRETIAKAVAWAAVTAASAAIVEVVIMRVMTGSGDDQVQAQSLQTGPAAES
jgi:hypothetical protein